LLEIIEEKEERRNSRNHCCLVGESAESESFSHDPRGEQERERRSSKLHVERIYIRVYTSSSRGK
jgi:hypothetical protein